MKSKTSWPDLQVQAAVLFSGVIQGLQRVQLQSQEIHRMTVTFQANPSQTRVQGLWVRPHAPPPAHGFTYSSSPLEHFAGTPTFLQPSGGMSAALEAETPVRRLRYANVYVTACSLRPLPPS